MTDADHDAGDEHAPPPQEEREAPLGSWLAGALRNQANGLATMFGGPIYLVGSALRLADPGDVDLWCVIGEHDWTRLFGRHTEANAERRLMRRYREELKQSRRLERGFHYRFDFQFQTPEQFGDKTGPRVRVDTVPDYVFTAGMGDA